MPSSETVETNDLITPSRQPPDDLNVDGNKNLRVTAVYEYLTRENVAKGGERTMRMLFVELTLLLY